MSEVSFTAGPTNYFINGVLQGALPLNDIPGAADRNGYLMIEAEQGEIINSVSFTQPIADGIGYDHLAFSFTASESAVPAPMPLLLTALGLLLAAGRRMKGSCKRGH